MAVISRHNKKYRELLHAYMGTREGINVIESMLIQLIPRFEVNHKGRITGVHIDTKEPITLLVNDTKTLSFEMVKDSVVEALKHRDDYIMEFCYHEFANSELEQLQSDLHDYVAEGANAFTFLCQVVMVTDVEKLRITFKNLNTVN